MSANPGIVGIHHIGITVTELPASVEWFVSVLGAEKVAQLDIGPMSKAMIRLGDVMLSLVSHGPAGISGPFDEHRVGLDHLSFAVPSTGALKTWAGRLDGAGVEHSGIVAGATGSLIAFRGPDNIALEFYTLN
ncbi:VOC family protein [Propionibacterium australiense]|uniref:Glyoxalase/Bleomycin resistance protein/Dioxygenase superfamily n=1 Tax=Propionibacterium australiense TaxID=119981 RepID=A0A383S9P8_9ACTN|nr:VOC family protein [Propionibacterium australiense]RLP07170.1 VOC family protein [Propionibacterium australiense]RLP07542.1 VOC family protein [Propionibacterium australiense]SYZ34144.1 Glyoxalase/Bleomycin resistance protein/Dioxygenase superfamily [Propionibacterium australiense]VEH92597.1 catechol 2,3 dioxygenase [Propionibacterium australiense]